MELMGFLNFAVSYLSTYKKLFRQKTSHSSNRIFLPIKNPETAFTVPGGNLA